MDESQKPKSTIRRIGGYLHKVVPVFDSAGKAIHYAISPVMVEFRPRDLMQVVVGASLLAVPVAFTEETWKLGGALPLLNVMALSIMSIFFIAGFVYFNFYRGMLREHLIEYFKRIAGIYLFSLLVVGVLLTIIQKCPWQTDPLVAVKRTLIVAFPCSMSAAISDVLK